MRGQCRSVQTGLIPLVRLAVRDARYVREAVSSSVRPIGF